MVKPAKAHQRLEHMRNLAKQETHQETHVFFIRGFAWRGGAKSIVALRFVNIAKRGGVPHIVALRFVTFAKRGGVINIVAVAAVRSWGVRKKHMCV